MKRPRRRPPYPLPPCLIHGSRHHSTPELRTGKIWPSRFLSSDSQGNIPFFKPRILQDRVHSRSAGSTDRAPEGDGSGTPARTTLYTIATRSLFHRGTSPSPSSHTL